MKNVLPLLMLLLLYLQVSIFLVAGELRSMLIIVITLLDLNDRRAIETAVVRLKLRKHILFY